MHRVSFIFRLNAFLVSGCTRGFAYLLFLPRGMGIGLVCTRRFSFNEFYNFLLFNFLIFICFGRLFLPTTFTHTHTHDPRPLPTTHDPHGPSIKVFHFISPVQVLMVCIPSTMQAAKFILNKEYFLRSSFRRVFNDSTNLLSITSSSNGHLMSNRPFLNTAVGTKQLDK